MTKAGEEPENKAARNNTRALESPGGTEHDGKYCQNTQTSGLGTSLVHLLYCSSDGRLKGESISARLVNFLCTGRIMIGAEVHVAR